MRRTTTASVRIAAAVALAAAPAAGAAFFAPAATAAETANVTVVHGIPDTDVDVYVDGAKALPNFKFKTVTPQIPLPVGSRAIEIRKAGDAATAKPILTTKATLNAGDNATIVANLTSSGAPTLTAFVNPTTAVPDSMGRLIVRHTAAAPAVDILAGGKAVISGLTNPNEKSLMVPKGTVQASVAAAGTTTAVLGPIPVELKGAGTTVVYAIGSLKDKNLTAVVQTYSSTAAAPMTVPAGTGGQSSTYGPASLVGLGVVGGGLALVAASRVRRRSAVRG